MSKEKIPSAQYGLFKKWLRYYLDFCHKYSHDSQSSESLRMFINKLRDKKQSKQLQKQAFDSIIIYYKIFNIYPEWPKQNKPEVIKENTISYCDKESVNRDEWGSVSTQLKNEIKVRHYSPKTFKAYIK